MPRHLQSLNVKPVRHHSPGDSSAVPISDVARRPNPLPVPFRSPVVAEAHLFKPTRNVKALDITSADYALWQGDVTAFLRGLPAEPLFDFVVTSPPYNIGKEYETRVGLEKYLQWQEGIINELIPRLKKGGSLCWQVGNYVDDNQIFPLDIEFAPIFKKHKL